MSKKIQIGKMTVGGGAEVAIQSMCNTNTADVNATVAQILALEEAGCEIIRVAVPDMDGFSDGADGGGRIFPRLRSLLIEGHLDEADATLEIGFRKVQAYIRGKPPDNGNDPAFMDGFDDFIFHACGLYHKNYAICI